MHTKELSVMGMSIGKGLRQRALDETEKITAERPTANFEFGGGTYLLVPISATPPKGGQYRGLIEKDETDFDLYLIG